MDTNLPGKPFKKWSQQRTGPFRIKRIVNDLAYELELPDQWKIHPVISSKHLLPTHADDHVDEQPGPVEDEPIEENRYEVEFIVKREARYRGRRNTPFEGFMAHIDIKAVNTTFCNSIIRTTPWHGAVCATGEMAKEPT
ncbi:ribonuclease H [Fusarium globosum]|uniref:Ribonuclease H n=1 Tax=Fusarium globosum TaxID=78864 RepID=A0A8H5YJL8_9HYPO|nr:ribonuclease H [Fusarium globosum]